MKTAVTMCELCGRRKKTYSVGLCGSCYNYCYKYTYERASRMIHNVANFFFWALCGLAVLLLCCFIVAKILNK